MPIEEGNSAELPRNQYVLVIHGTGNAPEEGVTKWYQLDESDKANFCKRLNDRLEDRSVGRVVWSRNNASERGFSWKGGNNHGDRAAGADDLVDYVARLTERDPRALIHLVAHSHGGNLALTALRKIHDNHEKSVDRLGHDVVRKGRERQIKGQDASTAAEDSLAELLPDASLFHDVGRTAHEALTSELRSEKVYSEASSGSISRRFVEIFTRGGIRQLRQRMAASRRASREIAVAHDRLTEAVRELRPNTIGRVVFLGTPFYKKTWILARNRLARAIDLVFGLMGGVFAGIVLPPLMLYLFVIMYGAFASIIPGVPWVGWNPFDWVAWVQITTLILWGIAAVALVMLGVLARDRTDGNLYSMPRRSYSSSPRPRIPALVIHAGKLDEALLGLSTVPLTHAYMLPALEEMVRPRALISVPRLGTGAEDSFAVMARSVFLWFVLTLYSLVMMSVWIFRKPISWLLQRFLTNAILKVTTTAAYGIHADELREATVKAQERLEVDGEYKPWHWNVTDLLAGTPPVVAVEAGGSERYAFLWDDCALHKGMKKSGTWKRVRGSAREVLREQAMDVDRPSLRELRRTCLMVDTRIREISGGLQLTHSSYYSNETVLDAIADFIADEKAPADAEPPSAESDDSPSE